MNVNALNSLNIFKDAVKIPSRRLIKDSKKKPLLLQGGGRFSTHVFLLFNDMFIHVQVRTCLYREVEDSLHMSSYCLMTCLYTYR